MSEEHAKAVSRKKGRGNLMYFPGGQSSMKSVDVKGCHDQ